MVYENVYDAGACVDNKRRRADTHYSPYEFSVEAVDAWREGDIAVAPVGEMPHHEDCRDGHGYVGGDCRALYSRVEEVDECRSENYVEPRADKHRHHGPHGEARRAHYIVERECEVCEQQSGQDKGHEVARIGERYLIGTEPAEHGIHECCKQPYVDYADC